VFTILADAASPGQKWTLGKWLHVFGSGAKRGNAARESSRQEMNAVVLLLSGCAARERCD
jgi:hypothetical protein